MVTNSKAITWEPLPTHSGMAELGADRTEENWRPLRYFNMYRATLSGLIITLAFFGVAPRYFGQSASELFWITAVTYFAFSVACSLSIQFRWGNFQVQVIAQVFGDIVAITLMMHASGGVVSGFGTLLVVAIAGGSILTEGRIAILFAAIASLAVLFQQIYAWLFHPFAGTTYSQAGMLGITFFATAFLAHVLAKRIRASEALAAKRGIDLANLAQLNDHIIQRMQSGVLVLDKDARVRLVNGSARQLLASASNLAGEPLARVSPELLELQQRWRGDEDQTSQMFQPTNSPVDVMASFARLGRDGSQGSLIYLEDASAMRQRAQQMKLASLGRLTASIAHEIRNPLGAISHAGQLLGESPKLVDSEQRLTEIIDENCQRMNAIVENILQLSRRKEAVREQIDLESWLVSFIDDFKIHKGIDEGHLGLETGSTNTSVRIDASQLHQIVWNLCENGLRHAGKPAEIVIRAGIRPGTRRPFLEVQDNGKGVPAGIADNLFEPFFTTQATGTGLGLYIARELCEINQASLNLVEGGSGGGCFRITFSDQRRQGAPDSMSTHRALIVDDEPDIRELLELTLNRMDVRTTAVGYLHQARDALGRREFDLCLTDMRLPDGNGVELVRFIQQDYPAIPVAMITAHGSMEAAIDALKAGAFDFVSKPVDLQVLRNLVTTALRLTDTRGSVKRTLIGDSPSMQALRSKISKLARSQAPIYISGESGTGKELVARMIHEQGARSTSAFVPVNCGAIPEELMESELFGHKKGSFTGAVSDKDGLFQVAEGGTLFLDEVADLPLHMQVKLLRAIQEKSIRPVGAPEEVGVDVRILSATHKDLGKLVQSNEFRQDLFYRINVIELKVPPLRERPDDIPELASHILDRLARQSGLDRPTLSAHTIETLSGYGFLGNVRELENILERALTMSEGTTIEVSNLGLPLPEDAQSGEEDTSPSSADLDTLLVSVEKEKILSALESTRWNKTAAAKYLGISFGALRYRMQKLGLE